MPRTTNALLLHTQRNTIFNTALEKYTSKTRPGYQPGWFTAIRHSFSQYPELQALQEQLKKSRSPQKTKQFLENFLVSANKYHHSFAPNLIDVLVERFPTDNWQRFYKKPVVFSKSGALFRGTLQTMDDAFKNGVKPKSSSHSVEAYVAVTNHSVGVSTSQEKNTAQLYATSIWTMPSHRGVTFKTSRGPIVLLIDAEGLTGIDIVATHEKRNDLWYPSRRSSEMRAEINMIQGIPAENIVGAWDCYEEYHRRAAWKANPNYKGNRVESPLTWIAQTPYKALIPSTTEETKPAILKRAFG